MAKISTLFEFGLGSILILSVILFSGAIIADNGTIDAVPVSYSKYVAKADLSLQDNNPQTQTSDLHDAQTETSDNQNIQTNSVSNSEPESESMTFISSYTPPKNRRVGGRNEKVSKNLKEKVSDEGSARVIVSLSDSTKKDEVLQKLDSFDKKVDMKEGFAGYVDNNDLEKLEQDENVVGVDEDFILKAANAESFPQINADKARSVSYNKFANLTGAGQTVCVIDTGVAYNHDDLGNCSGVQAMNQNYNCTRVIGGWNFYDDNKASGDNNGHGTAMAGIIGGNGSGYVGLAPEVKFVSLKISDEDGNAWNSHLSNALQWCTDNATKYNITMISIGFAVDDPLFTFNETSWCDSNPAISNAAAAGLVMFAPTGNNEDTDEISFPACNSNVISVSAVADGSGDMPIDVIPNSTQSIWGPDRYAPLTDLMAPGSAIYAPVLESSGSYATMGGTSYASAHAVGSAVLLKEYYRERYNQNLTSDEIRDILKNTGKTIIDPVTGDSYKRIDLLSAVGYEQNSPSVVLSTVNDSVVSEGLVSFGYVADDAESGISNCTLYINGTENQTHYYADDYKDEDTCSEQWETPCFELDFDNTFDSCDAGYSTYSYQAGGISEVSINDIYLLEGEQAEVTCEFDLASKTPVDGGIFYYDGSGWTEVWHENLPVMTGKHYVTVNVTANSNIGKHWVRCSYLYYTENITGFCAEESSGSFFHDNDDVYFYVTDDVERAEDRVEGIEYSFFANLSAGIYDWNIDCFDSSSIPNQGDSDVYTVSVVVTDTTPPATVTSLSSTAKSSDWIYWEWINPGDSDFVENIVYIDNVNVINTSDNFYNATGLTGNTSYTIRVETKDNSSNINTTLVEDTITTDTVPECFSDPECDDGLYCNGVETCDLGSNTCEAGTTIDCSGNDLLSIAVCTYDPDNNPFTFDYFAGFTSSCNEVTDACETSTVSLTHSCNLTCGAECVEDADCADTECDNLDTCIGDDYYNYTDVANTCDGSCSCSANACGAPTIHTNHPLCTNNAPVLDLILDVEVTEGDVVQIDPSATDADNDTLSYSFELPLNSTGGWQTSVGDVGSYDVNISVSDGVFVDWQLVNILVNSAPVLPDLSIKSSRVFTSNPAVDAWTRFEVMVENIGSADAENVYWIFETGSAPANITYGPFNVSAGEVVDIYPMAKYSSAGNFNPVFRVDYDDVISEENESNNEVIIPVIIS